MMLCVRDEQMRAFQDARDRDFARWMAGWLLSGHRALVASLSRDELERRVLVGVTRAADHGLAEERAVMRFVVAMFEVAPNFDELPAFRARLAQPGGSAELRFSDMMALATATDWAEARRLRDDAAWGAPRSTSMERGA